MKLSLKQLLTRGPEVIRAERVFLRELPLEELGLTAVYILFAGLWIIFSDDAFNWAMGAPLEHAALRTMRGINFVFTTALVLYLVLRRTFRTRRAAQEASRLSQERFEGAALASTDAIWDLNLETRVLWWSQSMQKLFGYPPEDVSSKFEWWHQRVHPDDRERLLESITKVVESGGRSWSSEYRFRRHDGTYAIVTGRGRIIEDAAGKPARIVGGLSDVSERRLAEQALEKSRQQLRALTARLHSGREEERARVAREIHDDLGQVLTALKLNLDWLERRTGEQKDATLLNPFLERVVESQELVEGAIEAVQRIATDLRPAVLDNLGLVEALREEGRRFQERSGTTCMLQLPPETLQFPSETSTTVFRVFQEALTNVARHAQAKAVRVSLENRAGQVILEVDDDGKGIPPEALNDPRSLGLLGMAERASALGGHVAVAPAIPHGTRVTLQLPLAASLGASAPAPVS
jgi:two-component system sensor histidine kinase UhpB